MMTYVLVLAAVIGSSPALFPYSPGGEIYVFPDRASCVAERDKQRVIVTPRVTVRHKLECVTKKEWDAIPAQFEDKDIPIALKEGV